MTDLSEAMSVSTSPDSSKEEEDFPPPPAELLQSECQSVSFDAARFRNCLLFAFRFVDPFVFGLLRV